MANNRLIIRSKTSGKELTIAKYSWPWYSVDNVGEKMDKFFGEEFMRLVRSDIDASAEYDFEMIYESEEK